MQYVRKNNLVCFLYHKCNTKKLLHYVSVNTNICMSKWKVWLIQVKQFKLAQWNIIHMKSVSWPGANSAMTQKSFVQPKSVVDKLSDVSSLLQEVGLILSTNVFDLFIWSITLHDGWVPLMNNFSVNITNNLAVIYKYKITKCNTFYNGYRNATVT